MFWIRAAWFRQALDAMTSARDQLAAVAQQLEAKVQQQHQQVLQLPLLQQELHGLQELHQRMQKETQLQQQVGGQGDGHATCTAASPRHHACKRMMSLPT